ncbi:anti-sigma factor [Rhizobium sp. RU36D]|uniref:anti-sigma factor n=1 Tax=Rhizobium sp. RU36D TaxID=1907415 RepID=UPI0009D8EE13|nr:anti-sigma factor [Rhizobium sp. RU36D]SMD04324.1 Anti-sigma-K factor RskA [Rhizobium sp. RU36D]
MTTPDKSQGDRSHDEVLAGEYVVGVLDAKARRAVEERMRRDRNFAAIVRRWEENLSHFDDDYQAQMPPAHLLSKIETRIHGDEARETTRTGLWAFLWSSVAVWRSVAVASLAALVFVVGDELVEFGNIPRPPLVAEMAGKDNSISLVARYDDASGRLRVTPVATGERAQHSLELWLIEGEKEPLSLGVLPQTGEGEISIPAERRRQFAAGVVLAVSLEPFGGSPTGKATGPILAVGEAHF